tara:strand:+ start:1153 stop:1662 length:510 start_codon:yes stop_codon:yes gene_type:complete
MVKPATKPFVSRAANLQEAMAAIGRLPSILTQAIQLWGRVEIIVQKHEPKRSTDQNRLQRLWCKEAGQQGDCEAEWYRGYCKYHFGLGILCRDSEDYRNACKQVLGSLSYEQCIALMMEPHDYPVTRAMNKKQKTEYLDSCWQHFTGLGFRLTDPGLKGINANEYREVA